MTTTPSAPNRQARGEARRSRIIDEAAQLLAAKGFRGMGITELAERVGLTHPGLLYYFGTKEQLLQEVVEARQEIERTALTAITAEDEGASLALLPKLAEANVASLTYTRLYLVLAAENLDEEDPLHDFFIRRYERSRRIARTAIQADIDAGRIRADIDVDQLAREVIATLQGLETQWMMDPARVDYVQSVGLYAEGLLERLAP